MAITLNTPPEAFRTLLERSIQIIKEEILNQLQYLGEECVTRIRTDHPGNWMDQTGNLRSSIGAAVFDYGRQYMQTAFESVTGPQGTGAQGSAQGQQYINELAREYARVYALVVVAGMEYADAVETRRDVLESTKLWAEGQIEGRMQDAKAIAEKRINRLIKQL